MNILTDTDRMQEASNELAAVYNDLSTVYANLCGLINYLEPTWKGGAATECLRQQLAEVERVMMSVDAMKKTVDERIRTTISLDRVESLNILNIAANVNDIRSSLDAAMLNLFGL